MTFSREKILDDLARMAGGTMNVLSGLNREIREEIRARLDEMALRLDLVPREEFERLESRLREAQREQEKQAARIAALEKKLGGGKAKHPKTGKKK